MDYPFLHKIKSSTLKEVLFFLLINYWKGINSKLVLMNIIKKFLNVSHCKFTSAIVLSV